MRATSLGGRSDSAGAVYYTISSPRMPSLVKDVRVDKKARGHAHRGRDDGLSGAEMDHVDREEDRQLEDDASVMSEPETISDDTMEGGTSSRGASSGSQLTAEQVSRLIEDSQMKIGKLLLQEQDRRYERVEQNQKKLMQELKRDILQSVDSKIDKRMEDTLQKVRDMVEQADRAASEAKAVAEKLAGAGEGAALNPASGTLRSPGGGRSSPWTPRTLVEVKGFCEWARRFTDGVSSEFAEEFLHRLREDLADEGKMVDWDRSVGANRFAYNFKLVIVMREENDDAEARCRIYNLKDQVAQRLRQEDFFVNRKPCFVVPQASPGRRELFALAGRFTAALAASTDEVGLQTKREYAAQAITILAWRKSSDDKNSHLGHRGGAAPTLGGGRWLRVAEWTARQKDWRLFKDELSTIGVDCSVLLENLAAAQ